MAQQLWSPANAHRTANGSAADANIIVGVTSWIYTDDATKQADASPFTSNNVASMVSIACTATPEACL